MVPSYLQVSLETLDQEQERFRKQFTTAFTPQAFEAYQEQARKNMAVRAGDDDVQPVRHRNGRQADGATVNGEAGRGARASAAVKPAPSAVKGRTATSYPHAQRAAAMQARIEKLAKTKS